MILNRSPGELESSDELPLFGAPENLAVLFVAISTDHSIS